MSDEERVPFSEYLKMAERAEAMANEAWGRAEKAMLHEAAEHWRLLASLNGRSLPSR